MKYGINHMMSLVISLVKPVTEFLQVELGKQERKQNHSEQKYNQQLTQKIQPVTITVVEEIQVKQEITQQQEISVNTIIHAEPEKIQTFIQTDNRENAKVVNSSDLPKLTVKVLKDLCKELEIPVTTKHKKKDIIDILKVTAVFPLLV